ncbi:MAG: DNA-protecting protein DprA [Gammaproteobacteria bacterium]|nr:DNA-protecting protein DprA [Gammaproteobacteria bacterium]
MSKMKIKDAPYWLGLHRLQGVGNTKLLSLIDHFKSAEAVFGGHRTDLAAVLGDHPDVIASIQKGPDRSTLEADLTWLQQDGNHLLCILDPGYPPLLREIPDPPGLLYVRGQIKLLTDPQLSIVGSRNPTACGVETSQQFAAHLCQAGLTITSGLALGIDAAAHEGALQCGGSTIAIMGTGLDRVYPASHHALAHRIAEQGALVSEFPLGTPPQRGNFPRRNRIISGISLGTLVTEAALRSGSLITARLAADQGREVFAIPGSIHSPLSRGCHHLIRQGAKLVETATDVLEELSPLAATWVQPDSVKADPIGATDIDPELAALLASIGHEPVDPDMLIKRSGLTAARVSSMLSQMELLGLVSICPGGSYMRQTQKR